MKRIAVLLGAALVGFALLPNLAQAQVIVVQNGRTYAPPVIFNPPIVSSSYYVAPSVATYSSAPTTTYSYYPSPSVITYSAPPVVTYSAPPIVTYSAPPVYTYSAPVAVVRPSVVETRSYYGFGILRPRGYYTETRVYP